MVRFEDIKLDDVVLGSVTNDLGAMEFIQKTRYWLNKHTDSHLRDPKMLIEPKRYTAKEANPVIRQDVEGKEVYLFSIPNVSMKYIDPNALIFMTAQAADHLKQFGAKKVHLVMTDLPFSRADKKELNEEKNERKGRSVETVAKIFKATGIDDILTISLHSQKIKEIFAEVYGYEPVHEINPNPLYAHYLVYESPLDLGDNLQRLVMIASDKGAWPIIDDMADILTNVWEKDGASGLYFNKIRKIPNARFQVKMSINKDKTGHIVLTNRHAYKLDDMVDTASTDIATSVTVMNEGIDCNGGDKQKPATYNSIQAHAVMQGNNFEDTVRAIEDGRTSDFVIGNSRPFIEKQLSLPLKERSTIIRFAYSIGGGIACMHMDRDVNEMYTKAGKIDPVVVSDKFFNMDRSSSYDPNVVRQ